MKQKQSPDSAALGASQSHPMPQGVTKAGNKYVVESFDMQLFIVIRRISTHEQIRFNELSISSNFLELIQSCDFKSFERETISTYSSENVEMEKTIKKIEQLRSSCLQFDIEFEVMKHVYYSDEDEISFVRFSPNLPLLMGSVNTKFWSPFAPYMQCGDPGHLLEVAHYNDHLVISEHLMSIKGANILALINEDDLMLPNNVTSEDKNKNVPAYNVAVYHESANGYCSYTWEELRAADLESIIRRLADPIFKDSSMGCSFRDQYKSSSSLAYFCERYGLRICISFPPKAGFSWILLVLESRFILQIGSDIASYADDIINSMHQWFVNSPNEYLDQMECYCYVQPQNFNDGFILKGESDSDMPFYHIVEKVGIQTNALLDYIGNHSNAMDH